MSEHTTHRYDYCGQIIAWEQGELDDDAELVLFEYLVQTGLVFQLQGCYGRHAHRLGLI